MIVNKTERRAKLVQLENEMISYLDGRLSWTNIIHDYGEYNSTAISELDQQAVEIRAQAILALCAIQGLNVDINYEVDD